MYAHGGAKAKLVARFCMTVSWEEHASPQLYPQLDCTSRLHYRTLVFLFLCFGKLPLASLPATPAFLFKPRLFLQLYCFVNGGVHVDG